MKKLFYVSIIALAALMVSCSQSAKQTEEKEEATGTLSEEVATIRTALELAKYGYQTESATALIEAANMLVSTPTQDLKAEVERGTQETNDGTKVDKSQFTPANLLAAAIELANDNEHILALADNVQAKLDVRVDATRGALYGAYTDMDRVEAHSNITYGITFKANELAEVIVIGDGDTDLDLYVYDENGNLIDSDTDYTDNCVVTFYPRWSGKFYVKIVNRGNVFNRYILATN